MLMARDWQTDEEREAGQREAAGMAKEAWITGLLLLVGAVMVLAIAF